MSLSKNQKKSKGRENAKRSRASHVYHRRSVSIWVASDFTSSSSMESKISNLQSFSASFNAYRQIWSTNHLWVLSQASSSQFVQQKVLWLRLVWAAWLKSVRIEPVPCDGAVPPRIRVELEKTSFSKTMDCFCLSGKIHFPPKQLIMRWYWWQNLANQLRLVKTR